MTRALARERDRPTARARPPKALVTGPAAARSMAEVIRSRTLAATGGRTYAEVGEYVDREGGTTSDASRALVDERTGQPVESVEHALWVQSTVFQSALMQAYMAFRLADLTAGLGVVLVAAGAGLAVADAKRA